MSKEILKREIRFSWHIPKSEGGRDDLHYIREDVTYKDGTKEPRTYLVKDFKRPVYVTKEAFRNHKEKKEFEDKEKLNSQLTTQSDINRTTANLLGKAYLASQPDEIKNSPYVYGYDITSTSLIKYTSLKRNDFVQSPYTVAAFDIETDVETEEIQMATIVFNGKSHSAILNKFVNNISDPIGRIKRAIEKYLPNYISLDTTFTFHENEVDMLKDVFRVANEWKPAFLAIWNMDFDIGRIMDRLKLANVNPIDVICDQTVPRWARVCRYRQGLKKKVTASGKVKPINPSLQWHTLVTTSTFYVIDAMCVYRQLRMAKQEEPSYSLDSILKKELNTQKLKFTEADEYKGAKWHIFMQKVYPIEYIVYNLYDCLSMLELDAKTKDLSSAMPTFSGITDFQKFNSQVRKITDAVFLFGLERDRIIGTPGKISNKDEEEVEIDDSLLDSDDDDDDESSVEDNSKYKTLDLKGWIQLLPQNLLIHDGLRCLEDYPDVVTNIRGLTCDLDATSSYPSCTRVGNVSKETCVNELISVSGVTEETFREMNLSICLGDANILEYFSTMFSMPALDSLNLDDI